MTDKITKNLGGLENAGNENDGQTLKEISGSGNEWLENDEQNVNVI